MSVEPGSRLGPYEVVAPLGAGGMGEVWRARDTRLDRSVAIKLLPDGFARNELFRARFEREARTISSLNHPHICTLFDIGQESGSHYLVMELLEGESLADRTARGPLPLEQVLKFGAQIADALDRAHRQGIVHRDLKPGNVMITKSGAKLLDFGLARSSAESAPVSGLTQGPTQAKPLTEEGSILGTFQYMAPEQLEGLEADARTDIFAFGALLYEMATGRRAFQGASRTSLIAAIVSSQPVPISSVAPMSPPALDHVVRKCLEKDPEDRWQSAHDVAGELRWISEAGSQAGGAAPLTVRRRTRERLAWITAAIAGVAAIVAAAALITRDDPPRRTVESAIQTPPGSRLGLSGGISISPDALYAAAVFVDLQGGTNRLWLRPLASSASRPLAGTEDAALPFWSPDSRTIGFFANGKLKTIDAEGGGLAVLCDAPAAVGAAWGAGGIIVMAPDSAGGLVTVDARGGAPVPLTKLRPGEESHRAPFFLQDGRTFLFIAVDESGTPAIKQASLDAPGEIRDVLSPSLRVGWVAPDILLFERSGRLLAQRYDSKRAALRGESITVADSFISFAVARDGTLLLQRNPNLVYSELVWVDRTGREVSALTKRGLYFSPALSPAQDRVAVDVSDEARGVGDIWIYDLRRGSATRLTYHDANESSPHWSGDGRHVVYYAGLAGTGNVYTIPSGGTGEPKMLVRDEREKRPTSVSPDGHWIFFNSSVGTTIDIGLWSVREARNTAWLATPFRESNARLSPDGRWVAYQSDESGRWEIYVRGFPESDRKWMISNGGGSMPVWSPDGRELFYVSNDGKMTAVALAAAQDDLQFTAPVALFDAPVRTHPTTQYDVSADGRFLLNRRVEGGALDPVTLIQNWDVALPAK